MNLKSINNLFLLIILQFTIISCSKIDLINKKTSNIEIVETDNIETSDSIEENIFNQQNEYSDFYNRNNYFNWQESLKLKKIYNISFGNKFDIASTSPSNFIISNNFIYYVDNKSKFIKLDIDAKHKVFEVLLEKEIDSNLTLPTSLIKSKDFFYVGFGNGTIIKIGNDGKKYWQKNFNDLLRTPIRLVNDNVILLFNSNKIISLNSTNGNVIWEFIYELNNKPSLSSGGQILVKHNLIFFVIPNGRIVVIDSIVGEPIDHSFLTDFMQKNILNFSYEVKLHIYDEFFSLIEDNMIFYTYDLNNEEFLLYEEKIYLLKSIYFSNNSLLALGNNNLLTSYNLKNKNIFWKVDLSKYLSKKDTIVESYVINNNILLFFSTGKIIQLNKLNGEVLFKQDLNLTNVDLVTAQGNYFILNQSNGKAFFYIQ